MTDRRPTSRWQRSEIAFGPTGRVVATALLSIPILYAIFYNFFFVIAAALWAMFIVPLAMRDIWRRVRVGEQPPAPLVIPPEPAPVPDGESIHDRAPPPRW